MNKEAQSIILLESVFPRKTRHFFQRLFIGAVILFTALSFWGGALLAGCILVTLYLFDAFFYSTYMRLRNSRQETFPLTSILFETGKSGAAEGFARSRYGALFLSRLDISPEEFSLKFSGSPERVFDSNKASSISSYFKALIKAYPSLGQFLATKSVQMRQIDAVGEWIERDFDRSIEQERWWSREHLARIPGIGKDWSYGQTFMLERYGNFINSYGAYDFELYQKEIESLESVLVKSRSANAIVVSDTDAIRMTIIRHLSAMIENGSVYPQLEHKKVYLLDGQQSISEEDLVRLMQEAERVGNIIFVIDNVSFLPALEPFFRSTSMQFVALSSTDTYYQKLHAKPEISSHFELVKVDVKDVRSVLQLIEDKVAGLERSYGVFFTYSSVEAMRDAAETYFQSENISSKAVDIAIEMAPHAVVQKKRVITCDDVMSFVELKTGIPSGKVKGVEKEKLLNLESLLHERVVGQDEAIVAISQAVRRSRSGLSKAKRPTGSFLFLGPTGVGKTETAKALGDIFFGEVVPLIRFDMSEFSNSEGLSRLIGDSATSTPGLLANAVREHPYGLLLLDEFEKSSKEVHNLFLQILDEGYFSDVQGKRVNLRSMIIIATSNAGSDLIMSLSPSELLKEREEISKEIISRGIFRPELLNRFDGVIFFQPLGRDNLKRVTHLMLKGLVERLKEKGVELVVTDDLISKLMEKGNDEHFGARPINRAIADIVEEKIAEGLIAGTISPGSKVTFSKDADGNLKIV